MCPSYEIFNLRLVTLGNHREEEAADDRAVLRPELRQRILYASDLDLCQFVGQARSFGGEIETAFAAILVPGALDYETFIDELLQDTRKALLGDLKDFEQFRHLESGVSVDEMQHPVVRSTEPVLRKDGVGIARELAVGKIEKFYAGNRIDVAGLAARLCRKRIG
jgi:hypothetical protein